MEEINNREAIALNVGSKALQVITVLAGIFAVFTALSAGAGFTYFFGYFTTVGAPWARDLLPANIVVAYGYPICISAASICYISMLIFSRGKEFKRFNKIYVISLIFLSLLSLVIFAVSNFSSVFFWLPISIGLFLMAIAPFILIKIVESWSHSLLGVVVVAAQVIIYISLLSFLFGILKGAVDRRQPEQLSRVALANAATEEWRLLLAFDGNFLITKNSQKGAFGVYKVVSSEEVSFVEATTSHAPWAPSN